MSLHVHSDVNRELHLHLGISAFSAQFVRATVSVAQQERPQSDDELNLNLQIHVHLGLLEPDCWNWNCTITGAMSRTCRNLPQFLDPLHNVKLGKGDNIGDLLQDLRHGHEQQPKGFDDLLHKQTLGPVLGDNEDLPAPLWNDCRCSQAIEPQSRHAQVIQTSRCRAPQVRDRGSVGQLNPLRQEGQPC